MKVFGVELSLLSPTLLLLLFCPCQKEESSGVADRMSMHESPITMGLSVGSIDFTGGAPFSASSLRRGCTTM